MARKRGVVTVCVDVNVSEDCFTTLDFDWTGDGCSVLATAYGATLTLPDEQLVEMYRRLKRWMHSRGKRT